MPRVLVTGGTGNLGQYAVAALEQLGAGVRLLSRRAPPGGMPPSREWFTAELLTDDLAPAVQGADAVLHLASAKGDADVRASERLLAATHRAGTGHFVFVSIIGCDRIPLPFYATKVRVEEAVRASGVPWTIARVAQFHSFVERLVSAAATLPVPAPIVGDLHFQPVDEREAAERLAAIALGPPLGFAPEIAGPEVLTLGEIAEAWLAVKGRPATVVPILLDAVRAGAPRPAPAAWVQPVLEGYRAAWNTPQGARSLGTIRFAEWLRTRPQPGI